MKPVTGIVLLLTVVTCAAQEGDWVQVSPSSLFSPQQLDQIVAPIALYPDPLIAQILTAATYPLEVVEADRWLQVPANAALKGDQLTAALEGQPWDPSVKSLVPFPPILKMMDDNLEWTEKLGDAFLAQQADIMDSVQRLRGRANAARAPAWPAQETVTNEDGAIVIAPANPEVLYIPCYSPFVVYGPWPWAEYPPYFWPCVGPWIGVGFPIIRPWWRWYRWRWREHRLYVDVHRFNEINANHPPITSDVWQHDPVHRDGVPYRDASTRARFQGSVPAEARAISRGYPVGAPPQGAEHAPPVFESFGRGSEVGASSARGASSMGGLRGGGGGGGHR